MLLIKNPASIGMNIYKQEHTQKQQFTNRDAVALMHDLTLTKAQTRTMKSYLADLPFSDKRGVTPKFLKIDFFVQIYYTGFNEHVYRVG